ncbi:PEP/pyruvate-binding domain-containing protein [Paenibacillus glufosinatiresistens]|uniref:PEP/pyruvate-binding domain-containing protein n=1 Tax=Paenibacillus glufosinatiresistens TaxID=3070657 RepID=UPI00286E4B6E|nr:PEP/pyruvate-binding domain-containing protein [Paenibacillus sp. YX.27]
MNILGLEEASARMLGEVGGKGANLGEMLSLGLPVPPGFCVTTGAYRRVIEACRLMERLEEPLRRRNWRACSEAAQECLASAGLPEGLSRELLNAYHRLGGGKVAVRSSATAEDLSGATFAGQQETFLNVEGEVQLLDVLRSCWASMWSERALDYRDRRGVPHTETAIGVVIQRMVPAESAGVLFTVDPVRNDRGHMLVEAAAGLGEALVSGQTAGEVFRLDRRGHALKIAERGDGDSVRPVIGDAAVLELGRLGLRLEQHFGCPQDVEFACSAGRVYLLQTRAITTLSGEIRLPAEKRLTPIQKFVMGKVTERFPVPPKPLDVITARIFIGGSVHVFRQFGFIFPGTSSGSELEQWAEAFRIPNPRPSVKLLGLPACISEMLSRNWAAWWENEYRRKLEEICAPVPLGGMPEAELLARFERVTAAWTETMEERAKGTFAMNIAERLLKVHLVLALGPRRADEALGDLLQDLGTRTTDVNQAMWELAEAASRRLELLEQASEGTGEIADEAFRTMLETFMQEYGHREGMTWYLSTPVWRKDPRPVYSILRGLARLDSYPFAARGEQYRETRERVRRKLRYLPGFSSRFSRLADRYRDLQVFEENSHFDLTRPLAALQEIAGECGLRFHRTGLLSEPEDIYYLFGEELTAWLSGKLLEPEEARLLLERRKRIYREMNNRWQARFLEEGGRSAGDKLEGKAASAGIARGRARIILSEKDFHLMEPGDILVCPYTNPSWTPLFASAAAVVTETGNAVSHAAIVAREYGIPAVMGVPGVTRQIADGQEIVVDGNAGTVRRSAAKVPVAAAGKQMTDA